MIRLLRALVAERRRTNDLLARIAVATEASAPTQIAIDPAKLIGGCVSVTAPSSAKTYVQWNDRRLS